MAQRPFSNADPFLQAIVLFLLCFFGVTIFMFLANGLINALWGVNVLSSPSVMTDYGNPQIIQINRVMLLFQHLGMFVLPAVVFGMLTTRYWKNFLGFRYTTWPFLAGAVLVMIAAMPAINAFAWLNEQIRLPDALSGIQEALNGMEENAAALTRAITETSSVPVLIFNVLVIAVLPALGEEMIFRGALIPLFIRWTGKKHSAIWISAVLFSAMHMQFYGFIPRMLLGALLGYLFIWSKSLWTPILAHFTNNGLAVLIIYSIQRDYVSEEVDSFAPNAEALLWFLLSGVCIAAICYGLYRLSLRDPRSIVPEVPEARINEGNNPEE